jgi:hypothetical protein
MRVAPIDAFRGVPGEAVSARWHRALDHRSVEVGAETWVLEVLAIHADGGELWIQIANRDRPHQELVLHVWRWTTLGQALAAMERWRHGVGVHPQVISVLPTDRVATAVDAASRQ